MHSSLDLEPVDYQVSFTDCQRLERLLENLALAQDTLSMIEQIIDLLQSSSNPNTGPDDLGSDRQIKDSRLASKYISQIQSYKRTVATLQLHVERKVILLMKLLEFRRVDILNNNTETLAKLGNIASLQRRDLKAILNEARADSHWMKVLTFIATMNLPANLLAALFSSDLIFVPSGKTDDDTSILSFRKAMGIYVVLSVFVGGLMATISYFWGRHPTKSNEIEDIQFSSNTHHKVV
ncbi:MAG: hypothetical protein M1814_001500 [Vezdaea aestivalis]|nr:MAG: hypothetical protein M1814_001500 [Vezdaea aestivalis]